MLPVAIGDVINHFFWAVSEAISAGCSSIGVFWNTSFPRNPDPLCFTFALGKLSQHLVVCVPSMVWNHSVMKCVLKQHRYERKNACYLNEKNINTYTFKWPTSIIAFHVRGIVCFCLLFQISGVSHRQLLLS